jgi:hypothetical protein
VVDIEKLKEINNSMEQIEKFEKMHGNKKRKIGYPKIFLNDSLNYNKKFMEKLKKRD